MDEKFQNLLAALIEKAEGTVHSLKNIKELTDGLVCSEEHHRHTEVGFAKEALWFVYWLWTSDEFKNLETYAKENK